MSLSEARSSGTQLKFGALRAMDEALYLGQYRGVKARLDRGAPRATLALVLGPLAVASTAVAAPTITPRVIATFPHDPAAFTQGLLLHDGFVFESTGLTGESSLRRVDRRTGEVLQSIALPAEHFGEGLALFDGRFVQLTWMHGLATLRDQTSFAELGTFTYDTEGWGLCHDGRRFIMTDGSDRLTFRDSTTFDVLGSVPVQEDGVAFPRLNELECVGGRVLANVWLTDTILHIDPETGNVLTKIDAAGLLTPAEANAADVLNGIAFDAETGHYLLTGKLWPRLFEVELELAAGLTANPDAGNQAALPTSNPPIADAGAEPPAPAHSPPSADASLDPGAAPSPDTATPPPGVTAIVSDDSACSMRAAPAGDASSARAWASLAAGLLALSIARRRVK
ncbi:MAG TPA: glutaminyl-peptide cyclotransferase [Polyangiaceae bacterium]|nr:glutaminyl-peptide cyclotransferase [Polyangiaceae bacterium]